jgi:hypothetical protein
MKIYAKLIDITNNNLLNDDFVVLIDESLNDVKERLFFYQSGNKYYPNLLKLTDKNDNIIYKNQMLADYNDENKNIYVTSLLDVIEDILKKYKKTVKEVYQDYKSNNSDDISNLFNMINIGYLDLTEDDLIGTVCILLKEKYDSITPEYNDYIKKIQNCHNNISKNYKDKEESLEEFYTSCKADDLSEYYDDNPPVVFKDVSIEFKSNTVKSGVKGRFIKLESIFNQFELSDSIPLMAISSDKVNPLIKVYSHIGNDVSTKEFKSWLLSDKKEKVGFGADKQSRVVTYKKIKGILFKIKVGNAEFITVNILNNGIIECRIKFSESSDWNTNLQTIIETMRTTVNTCVSQINKLNDIFIQSKRLEIATANASVQSITCSIELQKRIDLYHMIEKVMDVYYQDNIFQAKEGKSEEIISLFYKKFLNSADGISSQRSKIACSQYNPDMQNERKGITVNIQDNPYSIGSILNIYSASDINEVYLIVDQIAYIDKLNPESASDQKVKEKSNIKSLRKEYNIPILSTSCQKQRQPIIDDTQEPLKNMIDKKSKKPLVDSYPLIYKGVRLICPTEEYPYPGFTQKNAICCFTKDQRSNVKYISNMGLDESQVSVKKTTGTSKQYILTTDKILEYNKLGTLLPIFDNIFNKLPANIKDVKNGKFYRIGVLQNNNSFLNAVSLGIHNGKEIDINRFKNTIVNKLKENPKLFFKLNNGQIKLKYNNLDNYINWITNNKNTMNIDDLIELIKSTLKYNIVVFNIPTIYSKSTAKVNEEMIKIMCYLNCQPNDEYPYLVIFKRESKYELLVYYNELKMKYSFSLNDSDTFKLINDFYNQTCVKTEKYPKGYAKYEYDKLYNGEELIKLLKDTEYKIIGQLSNKDKKIVSLISKNKTIVPIKESTIFLIDEISLYTQIPLVDGNDYLNNIKGLNKILKDNHLHEIKIKAVTAKNNGFITNLEGYIIPILQTNNLDIVLPKVDYNYYSFDDIIDTNDVPDAKNAQIVYSNKYNKEVYSIYNIKQQLSKIITNSKKLSNYIRDIQTSSEYIASSRFDLIELYTGIFNKVIEVMKKEHGVNIDNNMLYLSIIANEIIDDNKENLFFKGIVVNPNYDTSEIKVRSNETVVYNMKDLYAFIQTHFNHDHGHEHDGEVL